MAKKKMTARQIQAMVGPKVTSKMIFNELHRFSTMDKKQLLSRLKRIKNRRLRPRRCVSSPKIAANVVLLKRQEIAGTLLHVSH